MTSLFPAGLAYAIPRYYVVKRKYPGQKQKVECYETETILLLHDYESDGTLFVAKLKGFCGELLYHEGSLIANAGGITHQLPEERKLAESHHGARILLAGGKLYKFSKKEGLVDVKTGKKRVTSNVALVSYGVQAQGNTITIDQHPKTLAEEWRLPKPIRVNALLAVTKNQMNKVYKIVENKE